MSSQEMARAGVLSLVQCFLMKPDTRDKVRMKGQFRKPHQTESEAESELRANGGFIQVQVTGGQRSNMVLHQQRCGSELCLLKLAGREGKEGERNTEELRVA